MPIIVVEHMEEYPSRWLVAEYAEAQRESVEAGFDFTVAGVRDPALQSLLSRSGVPWVWEHSWILHDSPKTIVLDLWADRDLDPSEAAGGEVFVIGGIMGDHPPRMRGALLSNRFDWAARRRLGPRQMSIHVAAWAVVRVWMGERVDELKLCDSARVSVDAGLYTVEVELPFAYPCGGDGRPRVPGRIVELLARGVLWDEDFSLEA